jgi:hypothetical protein
MSRSQNLAAFTTVRDFEAIASNDVAPPRRRRANSFLGFQTVRDFEDEGFDFIAMDNTGVMEVDGGAVPGPESLEALVTEMQQKESHWRVNTLHAIHSPYVQHFLLALLAIDIIALIVELFLDTEFPYCAAALRTVQCVANETYVPGAGGMLVNATLLMHKRSSDAQEVMRMPLAGAMPECLPHSHPVEVAHTALTGISLTILTIFLIELLTLMWSLGIKVFVSRVLYMLDSVIVLVSLALEITGLVSKNVSEETIEIIIVLMLVARLWRFARIIHSVWLETYDFEHEHVKRLRRRIAHLNHKTRLLRRELDALKFLDAATESSVDASAKSEDGDTSTSASGR